MPRPGPAVPGRDAASFLRRPGRAALALAAVVALTAAAAFTFRDADTTHGVTRPVYARELTTILTVLAANVGRANAGGGISSSLRSVKAAVDRAAAEVAATRPPDRARDAHRALVQELHDYASEIDLVRASVDFGDPVTIAAHLREVTAPAQINRTLAALRSLGYPVGVRIGVPIAGGGTR